MITVIADSFRHAFSNYVTNIKHASQSGKQTSTAKLRDVHSSVWITHSIKTSKTFCTMRSNRESHFPKKDGS